jgi:hypothetical protein
VYIFVKRTLTVPFLETLDVPTPDKSSPSRVTTTIAPQALILLNNAFMNDEAAAFAERLARDAPDDPAAPIRAAYRMALARSPTEEEERIAIDYCERQRLRWARRMVSREVSGGAPRFTPPEKAIGMASEQDRSLREARREAFKSLCLLIFNLNEFVYVD